MGSDALAVVLAGVSGATAAALVAGRVATWLRDRPRRTRSDVPRAAVIVIGALASAALGASWGPHPMLPAVVALTIVLLAAVLTDLASRVIPDRLTLRAPLVLAPLVAVGVVLDGRPRALVPVAVTAVAFPAALVAASLLSTRGRVGSAVGGGDVKLAISLGLVLGALGDAAVGVAVVTLASSALVHVLVLAVAGRARRGEALTYGPHLAAATYVAMLVAPALQRANGA